MNPTVQGGKAKAAKSTTGAAPSKVGEGQGAAGATGGGAAAGGAAAAAASGLVTADVGPGLHCCTFTLQVGRVGERKQEKEREGPDIRCCL